MWKEVKIQMGIGLCCLILSGPARGGADVQVSQDPNPAQVENEPSITINRHFSGGDLLNIVACYNDIGNTLGSSYSPDSGNTWYDTQLPLVWAATGDPCVGSDNNGVVHAIFLSYQGAAFYGNSGIYYSQSIDGGRNWSSTVAIDNQVYSVTPVPFADKCMMAIDTFSTSSYVNNIYVGWQREPPGTTNSDIFFSRSTNGGTSFSTPVQVNDNPTGTAYCEGAFPFVGADGDVYMAWYDSYFQGHNPGSLYVDKSTDGGVTWGTDVKVANFLAPPKYTSGNTGFKAKVFPSAATDPNDPERLYITYISDPDGYFDRRLDAGNVPGTSMSNRPDIIRDGTWVFSAWEDGRNGNADIYFNRSSDYGQTWELAAIGPLETSVPVGSSISSRPKLAYSVPNVYAVWEDSRSGTSEIYFNYSTNDGQTWKTEVNLSNAPPLKPSLWPTIAATGSYVYVAWYDDRNGSATDIEFVWSSDYGVNWSVPNRIDLGDDPGSTNSFYPKLACSGTDVYCTWRDDRTGTTQPFFNYSNNNGFGWFGTATNLASGSVSGFSDFSIHGGLACTGSNVYATWTNNQSGNYDTYFNYSTNNGVNWAGEVVLNNHAAGIGPTQPHVAFSGSNVYVGWHYGASIYFDYSTDNGATWQNPDIGSLNPGTSGSGGQWLSLAADGSSVYALWHDARVGGGFGDFYFNRSANNGVTWAGETMLNLGTGPTRIPMVPPFIPVMTAGSGRINTAWPDPRSMPNAGPMMPGMPNIYTDFSSDYGATWLSGMDEADVYCVRSTDGGATWGIPVTVNDDGTTYAQVIPWVVVKSNGYVDLSYYDFVPYQWHLGGQVRLGVSTDGGLTFQPTVAIEDMINPAGTYWVGEYNGMAVLDDLVYTVFTDLTQTGSSDIWLDRTENPEPELGACCLGDGSCFDTDQNDCENVQGGTWDAGTTCAIYSCPLSQGACCFADGSCMDTDQNDCENVQGGTWHAGTTCATYTCTPPTGACCYANGTCNTWQSETMCTDFGGVWIGDGSTCQGDNDGNGIDDLCEAEIAWGACCYSNPAVCMGASPSQCVLVLQGTWYRDIACAAMDCQTMGACCFDDGSCVDADQNDCENVQGGIWYAGESCHHHACSVICCNGRVGDANGLGGDEPTIGDVSVLIDAKFITGTCVGILDCFTEADVNQSGGTNPTCDDITIGDISVLIDYLFITGTSLGLADCL